MSFHYLQPRESYLRFLCYFSQRLGSIFGVILALNTVKHYRGLIASHVSRTCILFGFQLAVLLFSSTCVRNKYMVVYILVASISHYVSD